MGSLCGFCGYTWGIDMKQKLYVVEYASDEWGEHPAWYEQVCTTLDEAKEFAMQKFLEGDAVRLYVKEVVQ